MDDIGNSSIPIAHCWCDPIAKTSDCFPSKCDAFFAIFFPLHTLMLISVIVLMILVEYRATQKGPLWRIILACGIIAEFAKVLRTGLLLDPENRHRLDIFLYFLYNTHMCFGTFAFLTLLFFWARLQHDFVKNKQIFGKLFPIYVTVMVIIGVFYYLQAIFQAIYPDNTTLSQACLFMTGSVSILMALAYIVYAIQMWKNIIKSNDRDNMFFKTYVSAFVSSVLLIIVSVVTVAFNIADPHSTTESYLMKHAIYETLFISLFIAFPSGFFLHYVQSFVKRRRASTVIELKTQTTTS